MDLALNNLLLFTKLCLTWLTGLSDFLLYQIFVCLPPDRTWSKVNDLKVDYSGGLEEGKLGHEPRLEPCLTMLVIGPLTAMWAWWA